MGGKKLSGWLVVLVLAAPALASCGSSDGSTEKSADKPAASTPTPSQTPDADGFTADDREVLDTVEAYYTAVIEGSSGDVAKALADVATPKLIAAIADGNRDTLTSRGLKYFGTAKTYPEKVTIKGNAATVTGCRDNTGLVLIPKDATEAGPGTELISSFDMTFRLVRQDDRWLVDEPRVEEIAGCKDAPKPTS